MINQESFPRRIISYDEAFDLYMHRSRIYSENWPEEYRAPIENTFRWARFAVGIFFRNIKNKFLNWIHRLITNT